MSIQRRIDVGGRTYRPAYVVWELTLRCDQRCTHCGSRADEARPNELTTSEALDVVQQLRELGTQELVVIGGEAYLHPGFAEIVRAIRDAGIRPLMTTGGRGIDRALAKEMKSAGLFSVSVSIDGLQTSHDLMRATKGSFEAATRALENLRAEGVRITANTNLNRLNESDLEALYLHLKSLGIESWQVQLTSPIGRAADRPEMLLQPWDLLELVPRIAALKQRAYADGILLMPGNNLGYFGPEETLLRSPRPGLTDHFQGCQAGKFVMGIESDGAVKGCPSLQTSHYVGGNVRQSPLETIWNQSGQLAFARTRTVDDLWGFCRTCPFAETCLGGCTFTAHAILGRPGNNPYCHFRAREHARLGKRERLVPAAPAPGSPFDNGKFEIIEEALNAPDPRPAILQMLKKKRWPKSMKLPIVD